MTKTASIPTASRNEDVGVLLGPETSAWMTAIHPGSWPAVRDVQASHVLLKVAHDAAPLLAVPTVAETPSVPSGCLRATSVLASGPSGLQ